MKILTRSLIFLLLFIGTSASAQVDIPLFTTNFPAEEFAARRNKVYDAIGKDAIAVFQGAPSPAGYVRFWQSNEFYYLSGIEVPHAYLTFQLTLKTTSI